MRSKNNKKTDCNLYESSKIIKRHLVQWQQIESGMSVRSWAKLMNLSSSYLSLVLNSKRLVSEEAIIKISKALDLDALSIKKLEDARKRDWIKEKNLKSVVETIADQGFGSSESTEVIIDASVLLKSWIHMALLDFTTCVNFPSDLPSLAKYFNIPLEQVKHVVHELVEAGLLKRDENQRFLKVHENIRVSVPRSSKSIRAFHLAMMKKAMETISSQPATADVVSKRQISSYTVAVNEDQLPIAFDKMNTSILNVIDQLKTGSCTNVYQVQFQILPLLRIKN